MRLGLIHRPHPALPRIGAALDALRAPEQCDWHRTIPLDGDALGNDVHSNCVPCGALRSIQIRRAVVAGDTRKPTAAEALALYRAWSGWDGADATDSGTASDEAARRWATNGVRWGEQWEDVPSIVALDPTGADRLRAAVAFLGPVQLDLALPLAWENETSTWSIISGSWGQPGSWGAHRVCAGGYDRQCLRVVTWGQQRSIPWNAVALYGDAHQFPNRVACGCTRADWGFRRGWLTA
jgi:hypothetical protein